MTQEWDIKIEKIAKPTKMIAENLEEKDIRNFHYIYIMSKIHQNK
jgi:hypothetical protein